MANQILEIQAVSHSYGKNKALNGVSFDVSGGSLFGILGPNGGGKTTLFRIISTLLKPLAGSARICGFDSVSASADVRRHLGVVFQQPALDDELSINENLRVHGALYGLDGKTIQRRVDDLLARFGLSDRAGDRVKTLSGGLARRADLARGLLHSPNILLLDEPTTGLDPVVRHAFWDAIEQLRRDEKTTIVVATHLLKEAATCDRVVILDKGTIVALGSPDELKSEIGDETLWLESDSPMELCDQISDKLGYSARVLGDMVQVMNQDAHMLLPTLYDAFGGQIRSATVRKPTMEDVFMVHAGHMMEFEETTVSA